MTAGGSVAVAARPVAEGNKQLAVIEVRDSGTGFRAQDSERIFDRFVKAPDSLGSGLGLAIARAITEAHHGTLTAQSDGPGKGARFTMTLPVGAEGARMGHQPPLSSPRGCPRLPAHASGISQKPAGPMPSAWMVRAQ